MLYLEIPYTTTHIPDDIFLLPIISERLCELVIRFIHHMERCIVRSLEAPLIERDETITSLKEVVPILSFWGFVIYLPELTISLLVAELIDLPCEREYGRPILVEEFCRKIEVSGLSTVMHDICKK